MRHFVKMDWTPGYLNVCPAHTAIEVMCTACGERKPFDRDKVPVTLRHRLIADIEPLLLCSCGAKSAKLLFGYYASGDASG